MDVRLKSSPMEEVREARAKIALSLAACFDVEHKGTIGLNEYSRGCRQIGLPDEDGAIWCSSRRVCGRQASVCAGHGGG